MTKRTMATMFLAISTCTLHAASLTWGINGSGGNGSWTATDMNWWNGTSNVAWTTGTAVFSGSGGTVNSYTFGPTADAVVFDAAGYTITSGWLNAGASGLAVRTNYDATIGSVLNGSFAGDLLIKTGTAALSIVGTNFLDQVIVNEGELRTPNLFFSSVTLANAPGVVLTLSAAGSVNIQALFGGGALGGVVQPSGTTSLTTASLWQNSNFGGVLQDSGTNQMALTQLFNSGTFTNTSTYSGATSANSGTIVFAGAGSALNSGTFSAQGGVLRMDNTAVALTSRAGDSAPVILNGGRMELVGNGIVGIEESAGTLSFSHASSLAVTASGTTALLTFSGANRTGKGTLDVSGEGAVSWGGLSNGANGIVANYVTFGGGADWATVGGSNRIEALASYQADINAAGIGDHVKLAAGGTTTLLTSATFQTLNWQTTGSSTAALDLNSGTLELAGAGLLAGGPVAARITGGSLTGHGSELVVVNNNVLTISSVIGEASAGMGLTKSGSGTLTLAGSNSYSGNTAVIAGTLAVSADDNLGIGSAIEFNGGTLKALASFSSAKNLTRGTNWVGVIDTNGNTITFTGSTTALSKSGSGTLVLTNPNVSSVTVQQGTLSLPNPTSGSVTLSTGALLHASGTLSSLNLSGTMASLDIGGAGASQLTIGTYSTFASNNGKLTISFGIGSSGKDLWTITGSLVGSIGTEGLLFEFQNLGGVVTGTSYMLVQLPAFTFVTPSNFAFAPASTAAGWTGTFSVVSNQVRVTFNSVPEPCAATLLVMGAWLCVLRRRRG